MIEGELTFWVGGETIAAPAGSFVFGPREIPHTFIVSSEQARFLLVAEPAGFEEFMRARRRAGRRASRSRRPPTEPPDVAALTAAAAELRHRDHRPSRHPGGLSGDRRFDEFGACAPEHSRLGWVSFCLFWQQNAHAGP